jgi:RNA polymerase sigma-70 factor (ECF subfamily)
LSADGAAEVLPVPAVAPSSGESRGTLSLTTDPVSRDWVRRLGGEVRERREAAEELHSLLVKAARFTLAKRGIACAQLSRESLDDLAVEAAADALVAVLAHLDEYRGESRFTTWAWKFAFVQASSVLRRRSWIGREIPTEDAGWTVASDEASAEDRFEQRELLAALKRALTTELTPHQRLVFVALALNGVPVDVLAERLGTTRGALYKTLHDARRKLRVVLAE